MCYGLRAWRRGCVCLSAYLDEGIFPCDNRNNLRLPVQPSQSKWKSEKDELSGLLANEKGNKLVQFVLKECAIIHYRGGQFRRC